MNEKLITDHKQSISIENHGTFRTRATWNEIVQILCGLSRCGEIFWNSDGTIMRLPFSRSENEIELRKDGSDVLMFATENIYEEWILLDPDDTDYIRYEDRQTGSSICAQHSKDEWWVIQLCEPFGTKPGSLYYKCFFRGLGVIPPDLPWDEYYFEEQAILELVEYEKKHSKMVEAIRNEARAAQAQLQNEAKNKEESKIDMPKLKSPDRYMADREKALASPQVLITENTPLQDYAVAIQQQPV